MAVMDEFKEEREALKNGSFKEKLNYFWDYYKWYVIGSIIAVAMIGTFIYDLVTRKDTAFYVAMINVSELAEEIQTPQDFADYAAIDANEYDVLFDTTFYISEDGMDEMTASNTQKLYAYTAAKQLDVMLTGCNTFDKYAYAENFYDLRDILTEEQLAQYEPYFYYVDMTVVAEIDEAAQSLDASYVPDYPDPTKPEEMEEPVPVGIYIDNSELTEEYYFREEDIVLGIYMNTTHLDYALKFIDFLYE